ncbi:DUF3039 domain-containing protein [Arthrobacter koreensis]|uniref:DUF3039 domain-containing protein n=1 Tax=Arthrobacter koreensis TaxID=199136 RepID=UPI0012659B94
MSREASTAIETRVSPVPTPLVYHYHRNTDIRFSQITGASIKALCGAQGPVGSTPPAGSLTGAGTVCPLCATVLADIRSGGTV